MQTSGESIFLRGKKVESIRTTCQTTEKLNNSINVVIFMKNKHALAAVVEYLNSN